MLYPNSNTLEPKPCPFCGSPAQVVLDDSGDYKSQWRYTVNCQDPRWLTDNADMDNVCSISGPVRKTADEAVEAWNQRVK